MDTNRRHICSICQKRFTKSCNLRRHLQKIHSKDPKLPQILEDFAKVLCHRCSKIFPSASRLDVHLSNPRNCQLATWLVSCWLCDDKPPIKRRQIIQHYAECHNIDMSVEKLNFDSVDDFEKWKQKMEIETITKFIIDNHVTTSTHDVRYYKCQRDGMYKTRGRNVRTIKHRKINGHCPAKIRVSQSLETGCLEVEFLGTHVGHDNSLDMISKRSTKRHSSVSDKTEHEYCDEEALEECDEEASEEAGEVRNEGTDSDKDSGGDLELREGEDEGLQDPSSSESTSAEAEISEMKDRILQMVHQYLNNCTTMDQLIVIERAVVSVGPDFDALDGEEGNKASMPKRRKIMGTKLYEES